MFVTVIGHNMCARFFGTQCSNSSGTNLLKEIFTKTKIELVVSVIVFVRWQASRYNLVTFWFIISLQHIISAYSATIPPCQSFALVDHNRNRLLVNWRSNFRSQQENVTLCVHDFTLSVRCWFFMVWMFVYDYLTFFSEMSYVFKVVVSMHCRNAFLLVLFCVIFIAVSWRSCSFKRDFAQK